MIKTLSYVSYTSGMLFINYLRSRSIYSITMKIANSEALLGLYFVVMMSIRSTENEFSFKSVNYLII